jgi:hypothetical protein
MSDREWLFRFVIVAWLVVLSLLEAGVEFSL